MSRMLSKAAERNMLKGIEVRKDGVEISHLQFTNDTILFLQHDDKSLKNTLTLIQAF